MASLSDSAILEQYKLARDTIVAAIVSGDDVVEYEVLNQRKRVADPVAELRQIEKMIAYYETRVNGATYGRERNYAEINRR